MLVSAFLTFSLIVGLAEEAPKGPPPSADAPQPDPTIVYQCDFGEEQDQNYDSFPDYWTRAQGPRYPLYVKAEIVPTASPSSPRSLWGYLDGGSLAVSSPPIAITPFFSYEASVWVRTRKLEDNRVFLTVTFLDSNNKPLREINSRQVGETPDWTLLTTGPFDAEDLLATHAVLTLHVEAGARPDLGAEVWFGTVTFRRLPLLKVRLDHPLGLYLLPERPQMSCQVSGVAGPVPPLKIRVTDATDRVVLQDEIPIEGTPVLKENEIPPERALRGLQFYKGAAEYTLAVEQPGFYRVRVILPQSSGSARETELLLVLMKPSSKEALSPFGWCLPEGLASVGSERLRQLLHHARVGLVAFPIWYDEQADKRTLQETSFFLENLASHGVQIVGVLTPPESVRAKVSPSASVYDVLTGDPQIWQPSLEFTFARVATLVRYWQVGHENEAFPSSPALAQQLLQRIEKVLGNVVAEIHLGVPWSWLHPPPPKVSFVHLTCDPPLTSEELESLLRERIDTPSPPAIFVSLAPLDDRFYSLRDRVRDLVLLMAATREGPTVAAFHPNPFDPHTGLCTAEGFPTALYLPWRTVSTALAAARPIGTILLPGGSSNRIFAFDEQEGLMLIWNDRPAREELFLGDEITVTDVWGAELPVEDSPQGQRIFVADWPLFVHGVSVPIARWRQRVQLSTTRLPSVYGVPYRNQIRWENTFREPVSGELTITAPTNWTVSPSRFIFQLQPGEAIQREVFFVLPFDTETGPQPLRLDFLVHAVRSYRFSSYHFIEVGLGDVYIELSTRLEENDDLVVQQVFVNETDYPVSFRCELFAPDRRRQFMLIRDQGPGRSVHQYRFPQGRELLGKTLWLRAEEIGGSRILNYRITAGAPAP